MKRQEKPSLERRKVTPEKLNPDLNSINDQEVELLRSIREAGPRQVEAWRKIPALAWQSTQKSQSAASAYCNTCCLGLWPICFKDDGWWYADIWVDCETGNLVDTSYPHKPAEDEKIRQLYGKLNLIDPYLVAEKLKRRIERDFENCPDYLWVIAIREQGGVADPYCRIHPLPEKVENQLVEST